METDTLYEEGRLRVTYLHSPEPGKQDEVIARDEHELWIKDRMGLWNRMILQRGILEELAKIPSDDGSFWEKLDSISSGDFNTYTLEQGINAYEIREAIRGAYKTEQDALEKAIAEQQEGA